MMHHFFLPPELIQGSVVIFPDATLHQIQRVLRLHDGDCVMVLDNSGKWYQTLLKTGSQGLIGQVLTIKEADTEPDLHIRLMACVSQREKYEWILQKGTELGVSEFLPVISHRTLIQKPAVIEKKRSRWEAILREAAEQSHRGKLPILEPAMNFGEAIQTGDPASLRLIAHTADLTPLKDTLENHPVETYDLLVGPEGGFTAEEVQSAVQAGFYPVSLGKRILRMETAALAIVTAVIFHSSNE